MSHELAARLEKHAKDMKDSEAICCGAECNESALYRDFAADLRSAAQKDWCEYLKPSKLRVAGSIPAAPTSNTLKTHGAAQTTPNGFNLAPSAFPTLIGSQLRGNCGGAA